MDADVEGIDEDNELDDDLWEEEDDENEGNDILVSAHETVSSSMMDIEMDNGVDVSVPQLRDFLSDAPASVPLVDVGDSEASGSTKTATGSSTPRIFQVPDIVF
jgi:hypothetical protein